MTENMAYYTDRLQCSDEEKNACLDTVAKLFRLRYELLKNGFLAAEGLAEEETDPFFRACLMEFADISWEPKELERRFNLYLMAGDYRGGAFLNAVLISQGLVLLSRYDATEEDFGIRSWDDVLGGTLRGYFGAEYQKKVTEVIRREEKARMGQKKYLSLLPEFDDLIRLSPQQRNWLVRQFSNQTWCLALKVGGSEVNEFLMEGMENREEFERDLYYTTNVRTKDAEAAQREVLEKAEEIPECM